MTQSWKIFLISCTPLFILRKQIFWALSLRSWLTACRRFEEITAFFFRVIRQFTYWSGRSPLAVRDLPLLHNRPANRPTSYPKGIGVSFPESKAAGDWSLPLNSSAGVRNGSNYNYTPSACFHGVQRDLTCILIFNIFLYAVRFTTTISYPLCHQILIYKMSAC